VILGIDLFASQQSQSFQELVRLVIEALMHQIVKKRLKNRGERYKTWLMIIEHYHF